MVRRLIEALEIGLFDVVNKNEVGEVEGNI
jgi:hypothetical protein